MEILEKVWNKSNEYWIPKNKFLVVLQVFLTLEKLINGSIMDLEWDFWDIFKIKAYYDNIIQHFVNQKDTLKILLNL